MACPDHEHLELSPGDWTELRHAKLCGNKTPPWLARRRWFSKSAPRGLWTS